MTAQIVSGAGHRRRELGEYLPLSTPYALHIFPSHLCNLKCGYCLHSLPPDIIESKGFKKTLMDFEVFKKCIENAIHFSEPFKVIIFAGWGEPLTHPHIAEMVEFAKRKKIAKRIEIVSNGVLLNHNLAKKLIESGVDRIRISIQGIDSDKYREISGTSIDFNKLVDNITFLYSHKKNAKIYIKTVETSVPTETDKGKFLQIFGPISDEIAIEHIIPVIRDIDHSKFESNFKKRHCGGKAVRVSVCPFPFYMSVIHPDGSYAPCCSPERPLQVGNISETTIKDIWNGERMNDFRIAHLRGNRGGSQVCLTCTRPQYDIQQGDNLDSYSKKLLSLYEACLKKKD